MYIKQNPSTQHILKKYYDSSYDFSIILLATEKRGKINKDSRVKRYTNVFPRRSIGRSYILAKRVSHETRIY